MTTENEVEGEPSTIAHGPVTNQQVLMVTTVLFSAFVVAEVIGSIAGSSLSLLGDAAAMSIDVFTYITNMYAERIKSSGNAIDEPTRMMLEVYIPTFSICCLLAVTGWITFDAVNVISGKDKDEDTNMYYLFGFSSANFIVDVVSSCMFAYRGSDAFTSDQTGQQLYLAVPDSEQLESDSESVPTEEEKKVVKWQAAREAEEQEESGGSRLNLNMCSALTHLGGDTLRTSSVFIAAVVAATSRADVNLCDAWAAVLVSATTVALVLPLIYHIGKAAAAHYK